MRTTLLVMVGLAGVWYAGACRADEPEKDRKPTREERAEELDAARIHLELLRMEVEADREQIKRMIAVVRETELQSIQGFTQGPVIGGNGDEKQANLARYKKKLEEVRQDFVEKSLEVGRVRRRLERLEGQVGRQEGPSEDRLSRAAERFFERLFDELEGKDRRDR